MPDTADTSIKRRRSRFEALTDVHNRRFLLKQLARELDRSRRYRHPLALLSCDLDDFKGINDRFGHEAGDEVLRAFVEGASLCVRASIDWIVRAGGEEFVIVLPETDLCGAERTAERLRAAFSSQAILTCAGPVRATASIGATAAEGAHELATASVRLLLRAADQCLYYSKNTGRNRVTCAPPLCAATLLDPSWHDPCEMH